MTFVEPARPSAPTTSAAAAADAADDAADTAAAATAAECCGWETYLQGDEYMINTRDETMHFRTYAPADGEDIKALVFFQHG